MTCEQCQQLVSQFLDGELGESAAVAVQTHLSLCAACAKVCEDFAMILDFCALDETENFMPPNSKALWCRINNLIESEIEPEAKAAPTADGKNGVAATIKNNGWRFSFAQILTSVLGVALISSLLTVVGFKNYTAPADDFASNASATQQAPTIFQTALGKIGLIDTPEQARLRRISEQQTTIDYWNRRVQIRRANWDNHLRQAFDRNLNEINQAVREYDTILQENPHDELSLEMLDTALDDKMELLREFSDL